jgi:hypothetical protein
MVFINMLSITSIATSSFLMDPHHQRLAIVLLQDITPVATLTTTNIIDYIDAPSSLYICDDPYNRNGRSKIGVLSEILLGLAIL